MISQGVFKRVIKRGEKMTVQFMCLNCDDRSVMITSPLRPIELATMIAKCNPDESERLFNAILIASRTWDESIMVNVAFGALITLTYTVACFNAVTATDKSRIILNARNLHKHINQFNLSIYQSLDDMYRYFGKNTENDESLYFTMISSHSSANFGELVQSLWGGIKDDATQVISINAFICATLSLIYEMGITVNASPKTIKRVIDTLNKRAMKSLSK